MALSPRDVSEARKVYETFWESYFTGNIEAFTACIDDAFSIIGTSEGEISFGKEAVAAMYEAQFDEVVGKAEPRNRQVREIPTGDMLQIIEFSNIYVLIDSEWSFYSKFRLSTLLHRTPDGWKLLQQHGSLPDMRVGEGETVAIEKISKENLELRDAVNRRTAELESKNRELEIEASLERVRAVAMGMNKPEDMLAVCREITAQLQLFGVDRIRNVQTAIIDAEIGQYLCYQYFAPYDREVVETTEYLKSPLEHELVKQMMASQDAYFINSLTGNELDTYAAHRKAENYLPDPLLDEATEVHYCYLSIGEGGLGLTLYTALDEDVLNLFRRFHQVFSLAYRRFRDIQKAEAQAKEAQIEAALERVRSRSMAMQNSDELKEVIQLIYEQLIELGIHTEHAGIILDYKERDDMHIWLADGLGSPSELTIPYFDCPHWNGFVEAKKNGGQFFAVNHTREEKDDFYRKLFEVVPEISEESRKTIYAYKGLAISTVLLENVALYIENFDGIPYANADNETLLRFGKVFQQTYARFRDLQKAEAQTREAKIEASLEKVRAQNMAMHSSRDLEKTTEILFDELEKLNLSMERSGIGIFDPATLDCQLYTTVLNESGQKELTSGITSLTVHPMLIATVDAWRCKEPLSYTLQGNELVDYYKIISRGDFPLSEELIKKSANLPREYYHYTPFSAGGLYFFSDSEPHEEDKQIIRRFAEVFDMTYTRYQDLKKAEAQAREAQIEAALEKVRSRSLAMHKSDELNDVVSVVFEKIKELKIPATAVGIGISIPGSKDLDSFVCGENEDGLVITNYRLPYFDNIISKDLSRSLEEQRYYYVGHYSKAEKNAFYEHLFEHSAIKEVPEDIKQMIFESPTYAISMVAVKNALFNINDFEGKVLSESDIDIIKRFARVFDQTYTRFLDLQKAEAQAREAQIEAALERTRTQSMLMQQSDEIKNISEVFHQQLLLLNIPTEFSYVWLPDESKNNHQFWASWAQEEKEGLIFHSKQVTYPLDKTEPYTAACYQAWSNPDKVHQEFIPPSDISDFFGTWAELLDGAKNLKPKNFKEGIYYSEAYIRYGCFGINIRRELTDEEKRVLKRFSTEFERAYTRFLDLQKAEAQAREAQIEAAVERVRAQSMAMHHTDDLHKVTKELLHQLNGLSVDGLTGTTIYLVDDNDIVSAWDLSSPGSISTPDSYTVIYDARKYPVLGGWVNEWRNTEQNYFALEFPKEALLKAVEEWKEVHPEIAVIFKNAVDSGKLAHQWSPSGRLSKGILAVDLTKPPTEDTKDIVTKMSGAFNLAYQRFEDLQKAETQAREAKIETALEKVRSRTMGMQKSDELADVANVLFEEMNELVHNLWTCGFVLCEKDRKEDEWWLSQENGFSHGLFLPNVNDYAHETLYEGWVQGDAFRSVQLEGDILQAHYDWLMEIPVAKNIFDEMEAAGMERPEWQKLHAAYFSKGYLVIITREPCPEEAIFKRFAQVFDLTYTRFLDLQKAEAQAREAQIENALEKVRSRSLAMHKSDELNEVVKVLFEKMTELNIPSTAVGIQTFSEDSKDMQCFVCGDVGTGMVINQYLLPYFDHPILNDYIGAHEKALEYYVGTYSKEVKDSLYEVVLGLTELKDIPAEVKAMIRESVFYEITMVPAKKSTLAVNDFHGNPLSESQIAILKRFAKVFDQAYTRFLDLQKAEAQAREAQIENALEKVRSRSLAMQSPNELIEVAQLLREEMGSLGVEELETSSIFIIDDSSGKAQCWFTTKDADNPVKSVSDQITLNLKDTWVGRQMNEFYDSGQATTSILTKGDQRIELFRYIEQNSDQLGKTEFFEGTIPERTVHLCKFPHGFLGAASPGNISDDSWDLIKRATRVFSFAYTRFLDLQKAEMQTREAQIELSLERIRARVTGMQESSDLLDIVVTMRTEFVNLGHEAHYFWHMRWLPDAYKKAMTSGDGTKIGMVMTLPRHIHGDIQEVAAWEKTKEPIHVLAMDVDVAVDYVDKMITLGDFERVDPQAPTLDDIRHIGGLTFVMARTTHGEIGFSLPGVVPDPPKDAVDTLMRFAGVFDLAYRRFEDLKKAEAQARENQIELALEKVRSRTMTMERSSELADTSVVVFKELLNLGIAPNRLFIGIIKDNGNAVEAWATNEDGSKIENQFQLYPSENKSIQKMVNAWKQEKKSTIIDMSGKELKDYFHYLNTVMRIPFIDGLQQKRRVQTIAYFSGGLIGMAAPEEQPQETTELLERFAAVFNLTYTRFNDLKIAEKQAVQAEKDLIQIKQARQKAEDALLELKATQSQLIQQEKLASLGQLTAGIAHEIKNPLNFVNNFSEVSVELIDEALEEIEKLEHSDVKEEIIEILNDVKGNLVKVHTHGSRADSIVKSMLQHSRGGSGKMEPTDLNALIKEYINLSFHGMRAGKNPINVDIRLNLDEKIGQVNLIGEDFSRVLLNICNNAFDAMREKAKTAADYLPVLSVRTERTTNDELRIAISDNGPGIPDEIKDKILQPFFTTKKGTEGTGLGLSITNDIIKAHGGDLSVVTKENVGTEFIISLSTD